MSTCECHKINWSEGPGYYKYEDTGQPYQQDAAELFCCQDKVNNEKMSLETYEKICHYIPGVPGSKFPWDVYKQLLSGDY